MRYLFLALILAGLLIVGMFGSRGHKFNETPVEFLMIWIVKQELMLKHLQISLLMVWVPASQLKGPSHWVFNSRATF